jgi:copper chaperone CopZ
MKTTIHITGMHCDACAALITDILTDTPGVTHATVDKKSEIAVIEHDPATATIATLHKLIQAEGYGVRP